MRKTGRKPGPKRRPNPPLSPEGRPPRGSGAPRRGKEDRARRCALEAISRVEAEGQRARHAIAEVFADHASLDAEERARIAGLVYAVLRRLELIDHLLDAGAAEPGPGRGAARLLASEIIDGAVGVSEAQALLPEVEWKNAAAALERLRAAPPVIDPASDEELRTEANSLALRWSLDPEIARRLLDDLGPLEADALGRALDAPAPVIARCNRLRGTREELAARLLAESGIETQPTLLAPDGLVLLGAALPFRTAAFAEGGFELQDEGSQLISEVVAPPPRGTVVDACAGSGGKTLHLGALLANRGRIVAVDLPTPGARRLAELRRRARRAGLDNLEAIEADPDAPEPPALARLRGRADRVLVDAPCSGLGVLRRKPEARRGTDPTWLDQLPALQLSILERFSPLVAAGGRLVYATCTVLAAENEQVVAAFLAAHPDFERVPIKSFLGRERAALIGDGTSLRLLPHVHGTDGFFAAVLRRRKAPLPA